MTLLFKNIPIPIYLHNILLKLCKKSDIFNLISKRFYCLFSRIIIMKAHCCTFTLILNITEISFGLWIQFRQPEVNLVRTA